MSLSTRCLFGYAAFLVFGILANSYAIALPSPRDQVGQDVVNTVAVGFDLAVDHGTASVRYPDGSFLDIIKTVGSEEYQKLMRKFVDDATSGPSTLKHGSSDSSTSEANVDQSAVPANPNSPSQYQPQVQLDSNPRSLQASRWRSSEEDDESWNCNKHKTDTSLASESTLSRCNCDSKCHTDIQTLVVMLSELRDAVESQLSIPVSKIIVSTPTITSLSDAALNAAIRLAGLQNLSSKGGSPAAAAATLMSTDSAKDILDDAPASGALVVEYYPFALVSSLLTGDGTSAAVAKLDEAAGSLARHTHTFSTQRGYWRYLKRAFQALPAKFTNNPVVVVVLVGEGVADREFMEAAKGAITSFPDSLIKRPKMVFMDSSYSAARGAAMMAARLMEDMASTDGAHTQAVVTNDTDEQSTEEPTFTGLR